MNEEKLIENAKNGDMKTFRKLVDTYKRTVHMAAYDILKVQEDAEDISQEVFVKVFHSINTFRGDSKFSSWIYRIAVNLSLNHRKKMTRRITENIDDKVDDLYEEKESGFSKIEKSEINEKIEEALDTLTEKQRTTFILRHYHNLQLREIADIMDCSVGTVKAQLFRTLQKLQVMLSKYQFEF